MKKICIITNGTLPLPAVQGGASEVLAQIIIDHNEVYHDYIFEVFTIYEPKAFEKGRNYKYAKFHFIKSQNFFYLSTKYLRYVINKIIPNFTANKYVHSVLKYKDTLEKCDLVIVENNPLAIKHLSKRIQSKIVLHLHNDYINTTLGVFVQKSILKCDLVLCVSDYIKNEIDKKTNYTVPTATVHNGIDIQRFSSKINLSRITELKQKYGILENDAVIVYSGRIQKSKGIYVLIDVFNELCKEIKDIKLLIAGGTKYGNSTELKKTSLNKNIIFTGFIEYDKMHEIYSIGSFAVLPSLSPEAFALTVLEAQAAGLPVIITDVGGMTETASSESAIVLKSDDNLKCNLKNSIKFLLENPSIRDKMAKAAYQNAQKFSQERYNKAFISTISNCIDQ